MKNDLLLRAARGKATERAPVWVMRQAGRYLPEFRKVREKHSFFEICRTPELATEVTLQPIDRYDGLLDAAIIFSDILVVPQAMGLQVEMVPGHGPQILEPLITPKDLERLKKHVNVYEELQYAFDAITMTRHALEGRVPLIGFVGGPWTLMSYMVEGSGNKTWSRVKTWIFKYPEASHVVLQKITDVCVDFLVGQALAGAQLLQVFESLGGELAPQDFDKFALPYLIQLADRVKMRLGPDADVPMVVFAKGSWFALEALSKGGLYDVIGVDWTVSAAYAKAATQGRVTLQGNLDPSVLLGGEEAIVAETERMVREFYSEGRRYIANLGHGIMEMASVEALEVFLKTVHRASARAGEEKMAAAGGA
ncbi:Uroporphyrinogen decarboxylase in heme biosynthesis [Mortierella sp. NVP85]|nr:Uroporphyrinogen decarboxylase in heme biosynthesis [Mortierella sp. NVP85]